jgi:hypothetical protein
VLNHPFSYGSTKEFRDDEASSARVLAIAMPTYQPGGFPYYSPFEPLPRFATSPVKSKKMGISRNLNRTKTPLDRGVPSTL